MKKRSIIARRSQEGRKIFSKSYLLYLLLCGIVFIALLEIVVRVRARHRYGVTGPVSEMYKYDETMGIRVLKPNEEVKGSKIHIKINSLGFRGQELESQKSKNILRIAALGASTTFCGEVSNNDSTWPELVRRKLNDRFPSYRFEMINGGVPGYSIASSLKNLRHRIMKLYPDIVLIYHATNDISYQSRQAAIASGIIKDTQNHLGSSPVVSFLSKHSTAFNLIYMNIVIHARQRKVKSSAKLSAFPKEYAIPFVEHLQAIHRECRQIGAPLVIFTFSSKPRRDQSPEQMVENMNTALYYKPWLGPEAHFEAFALFNNEMVKFAQKHDDVYVDALHDSIPGDSEHFVDSVHFTDQGCRVMAGRVFNALSEQGVIDKVIKDRQ